ncbi:MAG: type II toxin-antitoxin system Phd/YefM family antitoxin [Geobacteraceae bacterium]|nr:type II toxin-antitoxin system Phd/YefM family antitoxin [Geobacteraceae bacterium]NTW80624.1 type II toxin-antitoxin system Phd/YefM family antitoxin [Geobacteraceae bacterium]
MNAMYATMTTSVTELKRNFAGILKQADDCPVAVLNHNRPEAYLLPAAYYERMLNYMEDLEDAKIIWERANGPYVEVKLDDL